MQRWGISLGTALVLGLSAEMACAGEGDTLRLFNGKDLTNVDTYLGAPAKGEKPYGKNNDPKNVFTVRDGMIRVSGEVWGCFTTEKEYGDYRLIVEYRWGEKTFAPRENAARDSGILIHAQGEDGTYGVWMPSIECQMIEGGTGDFLVLSNAAHKFSLTVEAQKRKTGEGTKVHDELYFKPGAEPVTQTSGRINWYARDPLWKDVKGFRGKEDLEKPIGEWNTLEVICDGDRITNILNGKIVNMGTKCSHTKGKILFQSEGAEVFFRRIDLKPLKQK
jgi:hypothetical protein